MTDQERDLVINEEKFLVEIEMDSLIGLVHIMKRKRVKCFNSDDGVEIRLILPLHTPKQDTILHYALRRQNEGQWRGYRSSCS